MDRSRHQWKCCLFDHFRTGTPWKKKQKIIKIIRLEKQQLNTNGQCFGSALVHCGSGSSFLSEYRYGSRSGSGEPNQCRSMRIRILVRPCCDKKLDFDMKNILYFSYYVIKKYLRRNKSKFERPEIRIICKFWSISLLLDPYPHQHSQHRSVSGRAKSMLQIIHDVDGIRHSRKKSQAKRVK